MRLLTFFCILTSAFSFGQVVKTKTGYSVCTCDTIRTDSILTIEINFDQTGKVNRNWQFSLFTDCEATDTSVTVYDRINLTSTYSRRDYRSIETFDSSGRRIKSEYPVFEVIETHYYKYIERRDQLVRIEDSTAGKEVEKTVVKRNGKKYISKSEGSIQITILNRNRDVKKAIRKPDKWSLKRKGIHSRYWYNLNGDLTRVVHRMNGRLNMQYRSYYKRGLETKMTSYSPDNHRKVITVFEYEYY